MFSSSGSLLSLLWKVFARSMEHFWRQLSCSALCPSVGCVLEGVRCWGTGVSTRMTFGKAKAVEWFLRWS